MIPDYWLTGLGSWAVSYLLHSTVILGLLLLLTHFATFISQSSKDVLLKMGLVAGILTASLQFVQSTRGAFDSTIVVDIDPVTATATNSPGTAARTLITDNLQVFIPGTPGINGEFQNPREAQTSSFMPDSWLSALLLFWLVGSTFFAFRFAWLWHSFNRSIGQRKPLEHQGTLDLCQQLKDKMAIGRKIKLTQSSDISSPMAIGLSQVCIPENLWLQVDEEQLTAIIAHELAHILRIDPLWLFFWHLMSVVFFFQPLNKLTQLSFQSGAEFLADATAVRQTKDPIAMINSLVSAAKLANATTSNTMAAHLLGRNATIVSRTRLLLAENPMKTKAPLSFVVFAAGAIGVVSTLLLPSISLASKQAVNIMVDHERLTAKNAQPWQTYTETTLRFKSNIDYAESIAGKQIVLKTKGVVFDHNLDGIASMGIASELRFVSRTIYGTSSLLIESNWQGDTFFQYRVNGEPVNDQQAAQRFIQQVLDDGLGKSDEFKRKMLTLYVEPASTRNLSDKVQRLTELLTRVVENKDGHYPVQDQVVAKAMLDAPSLLTDNDPVSNEKYSKLNKGQNRFFNAVAHSGSLRAFFNDFGYLTISSKKNAVFDASGEYHLDNSRLLEVFVKASGQTYIVGDTQRAIVHFLVRLHFNKPEEEISWLEE
jgi:beta-lactamase regulating signal transducer with metallopeptidase domain